MSCFSPEPSVIKTDIAFANLLHIEIYVSDET